MTIRSPGDTNYNTPRINSNSLTDGAVELTMGVNTSAFAGRVPSVKSTGDIINYLSGEIVADNPIAADEVIATLPVTHSPLQGASYAIAKRTGGGVATPNTVFIDLATNTINAGEAYLALDRISLDGLIYLGK